MSFRGGSDSIEFQASYSAQSANTFKRPIDLMGEQYKDVNFIMPTVGHTGYILPSFRLGLNEKDTAFPTSVSPYRDTTDNNKFTPWFAQVTMYLFNKVGGTYCHWLSCLEARVSDAKDAERVWRVDPFELIHKKANVLNKKGDDSLFKILNPSAREMQFPKLKTYTIFNVLAKPTYAKDTDQREKVRLMVAGPAAALTMVGGKVWDSKSGKYNIVDGDLDAGLRRSATKVNDENWPDYKIGDPTNPLRPLMYTVRPRVTFSSANPANCITFSDPSDKDGTDLVYGNPFTKEQLAARMPIQSLEHLFHIPSFEELTDLIIEHFPQIPYGIIEEVAYDTYSGKMPERGKRTYTASREGSTSTAGATNTSAGIKKSILDDDENDDIPMGDSNDDVKKPIDDPAPSFGGGIPDDLQKMLDDPTVNPDKLSMQDWVAKAEAVGFASLPPAQLTALIAFKRHLG